MAVANLSPNEMRAFREFREKHPWAKKLDEITRQVVNEQGGRTLEVFKMLDGRLFGDPWMMTSDEAARRLNLPVSEVVAIAEAANSIIFDAWKRTPEHEMFKRHHKDRVG